MRTQDNHGKQLVLSLLHRVLYIPRVLPRLGGRFHDARATLGVVVYDQLHASLGEPRRHGEDPLHHAPHVSRLRPDILVESSRIHSPTEDREVLEKASSGPAKGVANGRRRRCPVLFASPRYPLDGRRRSVGVEVEGRVPKTPGRSRTCAQNHSDVHVLVPAARLLRRGRVERRGERWGDEVGRRGGEGEEEMAELSKRGG